MSYFNDIIECEKCISLGINYKFERKENLDFAYSYKPESIKYLWIVESPPFSNPPRYFYRPELTRYDSLYREIMKSLNIIPSNPKVKSLKIFMELGHFLIDSAKCPVDKNHSHLKSNMIDNCSGLLRKEVSSLNPKSILIIKSSIYSTIFSSLKEIGYQTIILNNAPIPFPGSGQQVRFRKAITKYLNIEFDDHEIEETSNSTIQKEERITKNSIIITNITAKDAKAKKIRITANNKPLFPSERSGIVQKYDLTFSHNDEYYIANYTIGSKDRRNRSGIIKLGDELYLNKLNISEGTSLRIRKIDLHKYEINKI